VTLDLHVDGKPAPSTAPNSTDDEAALDAYSQSVISVARRLLPSVVSIRVEIDAGRDGRRGGGGSAIALTADGFLLASAHVV
jgi:S1-C subfamily serine protease